MKNLCCLLLLISSTLIAQDYDKNWQKVIQFENQGKLKSANAIVNKIHKKAISKKNEVQIIKCFFYESKYLQVVDENAQTKIIFNLKKETNQASIPSKAILNLIYGKCLSTYKKQNAYLLYNRTNTVSLDDDFLTWTSKDFEKEIASSITKTLADETVLKKTTLKQYEELFDFAGSKEFNNETLFEYLLKENIEFYKNEIGTWINPENKLNLFEKQLLGKSADFVLLNFEILKDENLKKILQLFQKQEITIPNIENQLDRIQFCNSTLLDSNELYLKSLNGLQKATKDVILIQKIQLEKAIELNKHASKEIRSNYKIQAITLLDSIIKINNRSNAHKLALQKKQEISAKSLTVQLQKYNYNNEYRRAYINYKNLNRLSVTFYKIDQKALQEFQNPPYSRDSLITEMKKRKPIITQNYELENKNNYFEYTTEILLPQLKTGQYLVCFESDGYIENVKASAYETITISNIAVLASQKNNIEYYQVLDRKTGMPLEEVTIKLLNQTLKTDKKGIAFYTKEKNNYDYESIEFSTKNDTLFIQKRYLYNSYDYKQIEDKKPIGKVEFYLDRAIYRPGQTVYYKGIAFQKSKNESQVVPNTTFHILLKDANYNTFKEFDATTNEFGSFSGEFVLPKTGLTGNFSIVANKPTTNEKYLIYSKTTEEHPFWDTVDFLNSDISFRVEEYKRPKFEVTFEPLKQTYQVNQNITVVGKAKAFAGSAISDAKVQYQVTNLLYVSGNNYYYNPNGKHEKVIAGETKTDASGNFKINFIAKPYGDFAKNRLIINEYNISATVTDINGETHKSQTTVRVGEHSLMLTTTVPHRIETKDKNEIKLNSTNLNLEFQATKGEVKLYFVSPFSKKFKDRIFPIPEITSITDVDYEQLFPYEKNEKAIAQATETLVFSKKIDTEKDKNLALDFISDYQSGNYKVVFSAIDNFNNPIETSATFQIVQSKDKFDPSKLFTAKQVNADPKRDGFVSVKLSSIIPELFINTTGNYQSYLYFEDTFHLENNETIIKIPLKKEFQKGITLGFESVFENQTFREQLEIRLVEVKPTLDFSVESFRNKIQPGSNENWSFQLKSTNTSNESEILAAMYDSSLDQFAKKDWSSLAFNDYYYNSVNSKTNLGFDKTYSTLQNLNPFIKRMQLDNEFTHLMWFGFDFNDSFTPQQIDLYRKQLNKKSKKPLNAEMISGIVADGKFPLPGVNIFIKGIERGTQTDFDGYYQIEASIGEELTFSYLGFETKKIKINSKVVNIKLDLANGTLQEVVVTSYGFQKSKASIGDAEMVVEEDNTIYNTAGIEERLQEKAAGIRIRGAASLTGSRATPLIIIDGEIASEEILKNLNPSDIISLDVLKDAKATALYGSKSKNGVIIVITKKSLAALTQEKARKNLSETAFFFPNLRTDAKGKVSFNFTSPEALTAWKLRLLAHNKEAVSGYVEKSVITQKELMVMPNFPRFFREKDSIVITAKVSNMTNETKNGIALLQLFDATSMQSIDAKTANTKTVKSFNITAFGNSIVSWKIYIPEGIQGIQFKILAKAGNFSDGEENILPVLSNSMLVTESIPIWVRENSKKEYSFENLKTNTSTSLRNHQFVLEYTSNPTWLAIQSLPYLMEYEHECAEQTFARFYSNTLASEIISSNPKIAALFETWRKNGKLNSKLEENEELKSMILAETPWLNDAQNEEEKKKNLALLFDLEKMKISQETTFNKLKQKQTPSGGFAWFDGGNESEYITRHILAGLGHLSKLTQEKNNPYKISQIATTGISFLDQKFLEQHKIRTQDLKTTDKFLWLHPYSDLHYLYARSFYLEQYPLSDTLTKTTKKHLETAKKDWLGYSLYEKGLAALALHRFGEKESAKKILESLKETASNNEDWGMYWITNKAGWYWHQAPIETQALLIEAFTEISDDTKSVDAMKVWLLKNKQTKNWPTTKSTTEAIYALLLQGNNWLSVKDNTILKIGEEKILTKKLSENEKEAETGYIKLNWKTDEIKKEMANITIQNKSKVPGFGGIYWQYFEDLDKIKTNSGAVLSIAKELYLKKNSLSGEELQKVTTKNSLKIGDLVTIRLIISSKEDMEFVHLKDMRAACFEPVNVLSEYQYKGGLEFYMSTKDAATHFFFDHINKGTYLLEYDIRVNNQGEFSNGITTIESMYAPEFNNHTKGIRINTKE